jgi:hypothetical protein
MSRSRHRRVATSAAGRGSRPPLPVVLSASSDTHPPGGQGSFGCAEVGQHPFMREQRVSARRRIKASAHTRFEVVSSPEGHVRIDGSGMLQAAPDGPSHTPAVAGAYSGKSTDTVPPG